MSNHTAGVVALKLPHRQNATLASLLQQRVHKLVVESRVDDGHEWMEGAESVPSREDGVHCIAIFSLVRLHVHAPIATVGVSEAVRLHTGVIERSVEHGAGIVVGGVDVDFREILVPFLLSGEAHCLEIPFRNLAQHVVLSAVDVNSRNAHLGKYHFALVGSTELQQRFAAWLLLCAHSNGVVNQSVGERLREFDVEINILVESPINGHLVAHDFGVAHHLKLHFLVHLVFKCIVEVNNHACIVGLRESPAVNGTMSG